MIARIWTGAARGRAGADGTSADPLRAAESWPGAGRSLFVADRVNIRRVHDSSALVEGHDHDRAVASRGTGQGPRWVRRVRASSNTYRTRFAHGGEAERRGNNNRREGQEWPFSASTASGKARPDYLEERMKFR
jgi:hypothetical protein